MGKIKMKKNHRIRVTITEVWETEFRNTDIPNESVIIEKEIPLEIKLEVKKEE